MIEEGNDEVVLQDQATPKRQGKRGVLILVLFVQVIYFFLIIGFFNGWMEGLKSVIGMSIIMTGFFVLIIVSLDHKLTNDGVLTQGTITDQKEQTSRLCLSRRYNRHIRYSYMVDGTTYTNTEAWYDYIYGSAATEDLYPTSIGDQVEIAYLPDHPECSLPYAPNVACSRASGTCTMSKHVARSAGALANPFSFIVFALPLLVFYFAFTIGFGFLIDNDMLQTFLANLIGVPLSCILYYFGWMKPRERRQKFSAAKDVIETPATTTISSGEIV